MRRFLQRLLTKPVIRLANKWSSRPDRLRVDKALTDLYIDIITQPGKRGLVVPFNADKDKFILLSDQHKGSRDGGDIFRRSVNNYLAALEHYNNEGYTYINLGDSEELWGNIFQTIKRHNKNTFEAEKKFLARKAFIKIFGNHDLYWDNDPLAIVSLLQIYGEQIKVYEGAVLQTTVKGKDISIFLTHGHQGDLQSDGNWFSKWFVSGVWGPLQSYLHINPNTPAYNDQLKTDHNRLMYEWSSKRKDTILITGHTHQPVFKSMTELESMYEKLSRATAEEAIPLQEKIGRLHLQDGKSPDFKGYLDTYFNTGCCCFDDGDITGIEIDQGCMRLIKWTKKAGNRQRVVLDESKLADLKL
ncbi:metallophosphoesterase [Mucilaginibacter antarcticus]|uniref:Metallophosphoesterase n=2 Tax=Mucilaginibacter antarcticus TaxID=1855725 RepID=A0ABW5XKW4_9SPHI